MTTHLVPPGRKPTFRRYGFKPNLHTPEYYRPPGGDPTTPGNYEKRVGAWDGRSPESKGHCSSSMLRPTDRNLASEKREKEKAKAEARAKKEADPDRLKPSSMYEAHAEALNEHADAEEERAKNLLQSSVEIKIGVALHNADLAREDRKESIVTATLRSWDRNHTSEINVSEFRLGVRTKPPDGLGVDHDHHEVDKLFLSFSGLKDETGEMDLYELKKLFSSLLDTAKKALNEEVEIAATVERLRERAKQTLEVAALTRQYEGEESELAKAFASDPIEEQIGKLLLRKNIRIHEILVEWDSNGDGEITKVEFRKHLRNLGVTCEVEAIDALFDFYDEDGSGTFDLDEIKVALKRLERMAKGGYEEEEGLMKNLKSLKKRTKKAQMDLAVEGAGDLRMALEGQKDRRAANPEKYAAAEAEKKEEEEAPAAEAPEGEAKTPLEGHSNAQAAAGLLAKLKAGGGVVEAPSSAEQPAAAAEPGGAPVAPPQISVPPDGADPKRGSAAAPAPPPAAPSAAASPPKKAAAAPTTGGEATAPAESSTSPQKKANAAGAPSSTQSASPPRKANAPSAPASTQKAAAAKAGAVDVSDPNAAGQAAANAGTGKAAEASDLLGLRGMKVRRKDGAIVDGKGNAWVG